MARAERAWDRFTDEIVNEDDYLIRLAEVLIIGYAGSMNFLTSVKKWYKKYGEITPAQARAVLNIYMTDRNYSLPLMMALNWGVESPSNHVLTIGSIRAFSQDMVKKAIIEQEVIRNSFNNVSMADVKDLTEVDTEGRIFPKFWKVNIQRTKSRTSDSLGHTRAADTAKVVHSIHNSDSFIQAGNFHIVTACGLYRLSMPDPFKLGEFTDKEVDCGKCILKAERRAEEWL